MSEHVRVERKDAVLAITLARPDRRNAITVAMYAALADAVEQAGTDSSVRLITLDSEGIDFTSGNDLADFLQSRPDATEPDDVPVWRYLRALAKNEVPILACVRGNAVGIGTTMLMHCDLVVAERGCRFHMPFVDLGLVPEAASSLIFPEVAGRRRAARYILLGEPFGADEARAAGLISHVAEQGQGGAVRDKLVEALLAKPAEAMRQTQRLLRTVDREAVLERMQLENGHFAERLQSDEVKQAIAAFFAARSKAQAPAT
jgi:enoyl-CoA hydratase/carnithine racemase